MITLDDLIALGKPKEHYKLPTCEIIGCQSDTVARVVIAEAWFDLCAKHYMVYLSYVGLIRESVI